MLHDFTRLRKPPGNDIVIGQYEGRGSEVLTKLMKLPVGCIQQCPARPAQNGMYTWCAACMHPARVYSRSQVCLKLDVGLYVLKLCGMPSASSQAAVSKVLPLLASQDGRERIGLYKNTYRKDDSEHWQASVGLPGNRRCNVGEHELHVVAACMADDAARGIQAAGITKLSALNFDDETRRMVGQNILQAAVIHRHIYAYVI